MSASPIGKNNIAFINKLLFIVIMFFLLTKIFASSWAFIILTIFKNCKNFYFLKEIYV